MATAPIVPPAAGAPAVPAAPAPVPVIRSWGPMDWYTVVFGLVLIYTILPLPLAAVANRFALDGVILTLIIVTAIGDMFIGWFPGSWLVTGAIDLVRRVLGMKPLDELDVEERRSVTRRVYEGFATYAYLKYIALFLLIWLPLKGNGHFALAALALSVILIIGFPVWSSKKPWIGRALYNLFWPALILVIALWAVLVNWPDLRPSAAKSETEQAEQDAREARDEWLKQEATRMRKWMATLPPNLTHEQKVAKLSPEDRKVWDEAQASFAKRAFRATGAASAVSAISSAAGGGATSSVPAAVSTAAGAISLGGSGTSVGPCQAIGRPTSFQKELIYCPGLANGPQSFGKLDTPKRFKLVCEGTRHMRVYGSGGAQDWTVDCNGNGFNGQAGTTSAPDHWSFALKGEAIGQVVAYADGVTQRLGSCFEAKDEVRVDANDGHYRQGGHGGLRIRLVEC